jgi:hypothetical protein
VALRVSKDPLVLEDLAAVKGLVVPPLVLKDLEMPMEMPVLEDQLILKVLLA